MNGEHNLNNPQHPACFIPRVNAQPFFHGSLFSGIGGFDLAAEWTGWQNAFHCEWNEFGQKILKHYWPKAISYGDITKTDFTIHRGTIDVLTGGFPCQPYSLAGKRKGKEDERHLWPEMLRAIREISPTYIVGENVYGLVNWNGGLVFHEVQTDLENEGYEVLTFILPAVGVNAPHKRDRVWFIAYSNTQQREREKRGFQPEYKNGSRNETAKDSLCDGRTFREIVEEGSDIRELRNISAGGGNRIYLPEGITSNANGNIGRKRRMHKTRQEKTERYTCSFNSRSFRSNWENFPVEPPICNGDDGISSKLDGITFSKWRTESIKALGNAIVPQVALQIFNAINLHAASYGWR